MENLQSCVDRLITFYSTSRIKLNTAKTETKIFILNPVPAVPGVEINFRSSEIPWKPTHRSRAYTQGIFQSIGFKEFHSYLIMDEREKQTEKGKQLLQEGVEELKVATRQYARRQRRWIRNRFLRATDREVPPIYSLDATDLSKWDQDVLGPAAAVVSRLLDPKWKGDVPAPMPKELKPLPESKGEHYCNICQRVFIGDLQWEAHKKSKKHLRMVKKRSRQNSLHEPLPKKQEVTAEAEEVT